MSTQLFSSVTNEITFKDCKGAIELNEWNTLHENLCGGNFKVLPYTQKFNYNTQRSLQFGSTLNELPVLKSYNKTTGAIIATITGNLVNEIIGVDNRYYYNFTFTLDSNYLNKDVYFIITQGADILTSEPIFTYDMTEEITKRIIHKIEYANKKTDANPLVGFGVDWDNIGAELLTIWVEGQTLKAHNKSKTETLEGSQSISIVSATLKTGRILATDPMPFYMYEKLMAITVLDYFYVDGIQYIIDGEISDDDFGGSTVSQHKLNLIRKVNLGINVDNIGVTTTTTEESTMNDIFLNQGADFTVPNKTGYDLHYIKVTHSNTSSGNPATVIAGYSYAGTEIIDSMNGTVLTGEKQSYIVHNAYASDLYIGISGDAVQLNITVSYTKNT